MLQPEYLKLQFPALQSSSSVYLDNAATTQIPESVMQAVADYERAGRGNPYRGLHGFSERATTCLASSRTQVANYIGALPENLVFTKSATEGLNFLAQTLGSDLGPGDEVLLTIFEHHANLLPWRELAKRRGFTLKYLSMSKDGGIDLNVFETLLTPSVKVLAMTQASNVLGTLLPVDILATKAKAMGAWVVIDGSQVAGKIPLDVCQLDIDAFVFGAHKMYGPDGIGAVYLSDQLRSQLKPWLYGGGMVEEVLSETVRYVQGIGLYEAGTPNVSGAVGFAAACTFLQTLELDQVHNHDVKLAQYLLEGVKNLPKLQVYDPEPVCGRVGILSFALQNIHSHDAAQLLADRDIAVRAGYHCAAPLTRCLNPDGTLRVSFGVYNTTADIDRFLEGLEYVFDRLRI
jgi:cysteine desulfurase / selenocysteine lyase